MNKAQRLVLLMTTLNTKRRVTARELAEHCGVSRRTILRDLQELEELGVPLYAEPGAAGGYMVVNDRTLPPITFTEQEACAMFFACQALTRYRSLPFEAQSRSALDKFYSRLPPDTRHRIDSLRRKLLFWSPAAETAETPFLQELLDAALESKVLTIAYGSERKVSSRDILPLGLYTMNGRWYCPALEAEAGAYRLFRADRMLQVAVSERQELPFPVPAQDTIEQWIRYEEGGDEWELTAELSRRGVVRCRSEVWLSQGLTELPDGTGRLRLPMKASYLEWAAEYFLCLGRDARVLRPEPLRSRIRMLAEEARSVYADSTEERKDDRP